MKDIKSLNSPTFPMFVDPKTNWSGGAYIDEGPFFRHLLALTTGNSSSLSADPDERRGAERCCVQLGIEVYGYDADLSLVHAYGTTADVSASGLYALLDVDLPIGARTVVAVRPSQPVLEPRILRGKVVRCSDSTDGYGLAIHFDLDVERFAYEAA